MPEMRIGLIEEIATLPLVYPLTAGWVSASGVSLNVRRVAAAEAAELLDDGALDAAMIPTADYPLRARSVRLLPFGLSHEKRSNIALVGAQRLDLLDGKPVAVGSVANPAMPLLRVLLKRYFGMDMSLRADELMWQDLPAHAEAGLDEWETMRAVLLLGDAALAALANIVPASEAEAITVEDLGKNWWIMSGVTFTNYIIALRRDYAEQQRDAALALAAACREAIRVGNEQQPTILQVAAERAIAAGFTLSPEAATAFYAEQRYDVTPGMAGAIMAFYSYAAGLRLLPQPSALNFVELRSSQRIVKTDKRIIG